MAELRYDVAQGLDNYWDKVGIPERPLESAAWQ